MCMGVAREAMVVKVDSTAMEKDDRLWGIEGRDCSGLSALIAIVKAR